MRCPRFCARLRPSAGRVRIRSRSTSAKPPKTAIINRPVLVPVSAHGSASERNCAFASTICLTTIGAITFTGSVVAFAKLQGLVSGRPLVFPMQHPLNAGLAILLVVLLVWFAATELPIAFALVVLVSLALGFLLIVPIGGADMPVVISMLNSYSGWAAAGIGFTLGNSALIVTGALVGSSGAILSYIMCRGMNRSFISVILGGFGGETAVPAGSLEAETRPVKQGSAEDAAKILLAAKKVIVAPGYGMAVAQAQHSVVEVADILKSK